MQHTISRLLPHYAMETEKWLKKSTVTVIRHKFTRSSCKLLKHLKKTLKMLHNNMNPYLKFQYIIEEKQNNLQMYSLNIND